MDKEIVFTSSYSSQLGALISLSKYLSNIDLKKHSKKIFIFQISSKGDLDCDYSCFREGAGIILGKNFNIKIIKINQIYKRLILLFALSAFKFPVFKKNLSIWEPYPNWLKRLFVYKSMCLTLRIMKHVICNDCGKRIQKNGILYHCEECQKMHRYA